MTHRSHAPTRDRLGPWIHALRQRLDRVRPEGAAASGRVLADQLAALAAGDSETVCASLAPDVVVHAWGVVPGGHWSWRGLSARDAITELLAAPPVPVESGRIDIDRFFPGGDDIGFDGDLSWQVVDGGSMLLVQRRIGVFATYRDGLLSELDVYVDVHEAADVSDRAGQ